jgi:hypothetical protein
MFHISQIPMKNFRSVFFTLLLSAITIFPNGIALATEIFEEETFKQDNANIIGQEVYKMENRTEIQKEKIELEKQYEKKIEIENELDKKVGKILEEKTKNTRLLSQAISIKKSDKIKAMNAAVRLLGNSKELLNEEQDLLIHFLLKYAPYSGNQELIQKSQDITGKNISEQSLFKIAGPYDRNEAVRYAYKHVDNYNTMYPDLNLLGGDCTNFVSQVMKAGGKSLRLSWYSFRKNMRYLKPASIWQLNYSWALADPSPWISAKEFEIFWGRRLDNETFSASYVANNQSIIFWKPYYRGDVIQILKKRYWWYEAYHTMVITSYINQDFGMTYHTIDDKDRLLNNIAEQYNNSNYKFKFYSVKK